MSSIHLLDPELQDTIIQSGSFKFIKHPMVNEMFFDHPLEVERYNEVLRQKTHEVVRSIASEDFGKALALVERPWRVAYLHRLAVAERLITDAVTFNELLSWVWTDTEYPHQAAAEWRDLWSHPLVSPHMLMDETERADFDTLPHKFTVYRGAAGEREWAESGLSWTLDKARAEWFSRRLAKEGEESFVVKAVVNKSEDRLVFLNGRGEQEIVRVPA